jgi:hypothetical protein
MEPNFQTSFIPKKPVIEKKAIVAQSVGFFSVIAIFIFFAVLVLTGLSYFYKINLRKSVAQKQSDLALARNRFEPEKIAELKLLDKRLSAANSILSKHIAITPVFKLLQSITMKTVRYTKFTYELGTEQNPNITIKMAGVAVGYSSVALQSDLYAKNKNLINPVFSNLVLDEKGNVMFDLEFSVDPSFVDYKQMLLTEGLNFL